MLVGALEDPGLVVEPVRQLLGVLLLLGRGGVFQGVLDPGHVEGPDGYVAKNRMHDCPELGGLDSVLKAQFLHLGVEPIHEIIHGLPPDTGDPVLHHG